MNDRVAENSTMIETGIQNPWLDHLIKQEIDFKVNKKYTDFVLPEEYGSVVIDELTSVPFENDDLRKYLVSRLGECLRNGKNWVCLYRDVDNLNQANKKCGRQFGDMVIRYGISNTAQLLDRLDLNPKAEVCLHREKIAADETVVWIFDIDDEEIERLREEVRKSDRSILVNLDDKKSYHFSITSSVIDQDDSQHEQLIQKTRDWLKEKATEESRQLPFLLYQTIKEQGDTNVKVAKIEKDPERLFQNEFLLKEGNIEALIRLLTSQFGDSRISGKLLKLICQLTSIASFASFTRQNPQAKEAYLFLLKELGVEEERLSTAKTPVEIVEIFQELFGIEE